MKGPCPETCRLHCSVNFTENQRRDIFNNYWNLGDLERQRSFIAASLECCNPKYRYPRQEKQRKLNQSFFFFITGKKDHGM